MKFTLSAENMNPLLAVLSKFTKDANPVVQAYEFISVQRVGDGLSFQGTCGERSMRCLLPVEGVKGGGGFCVPYAKFRTLFAGFHSDIRFTYSVIRNRLSWRSGASKGWLPAIPWHQYPDLSLDDDPEWFDVSVTNFGGAIDYVKSAIPKVHNNDIFLGVDLRVRTDDGVLYLCLTTADSQRLHHARLPLTLNTGALPTILKNQGVVLPSDNVAAFRALLGKARVGLSRVRLYIGGNVMRVASPNGSMEASLMLIPGRFPDMSPVLGSYKEKERYAVDVNAKEFARSIKTVATYGDSDLKTLQLKFRTEGIELSAKDSQKGSIKTICVADTKGVSAISSYSQVHLAEAVKRVPGSEKMSLIHLGPEAPLFVLSEHREVFACLMPVAV